MKLNPTPRDELANELSERAKGNDVFVFGSGLGFVPESKVIEIGPTNLFQEHHWVVTGYYPNYDDQEVAVFIAPATALLQFGGAQSL